MVSVATACGWCGIQQRPCGCWPKLTHRALSWIQRQRPHLACAGQSRRLSWFSLPDSDRGKELHVGDTFFLISIFLSFTPPALFFQYYKLNLGSSHWAIAQSLFIYLFILRVLLNCQGGAGTCDPPVSTSQSARVTGMPGHT